ncbi:MAG: lipoyl(octanoyl) transferase LipB [Enterobacteriaceae bacterium]
MSTIIVRQLGLQPYEVVFDAMHHFTQQRTADSHDEIWLVQHPPVFTQGRAGKAEHLLVSSDIPVIHSDRGGQVTYHGPGQIILYPLLELKRYSLSVRQLVSLLENSVIATLTQLGITAVARPDAPGVYCDGDKICSLGLRIRKGCSLHGLALNVDMDLTPFSYINPCGYTGLKMTQIKNRRPDVTLAQVSDLLLHHFNHLLGDPESEEQPWNPHDYE